MNKDKDIQRNAELFVSLLNMLTVFSKDKIQYDMDEITNYTGLSIKRFSVMYNISFKKGQNLKELASKLRTSSSSLSILIDHLVEDNLIIREKNPEDRREIILNLSPKGEKLLDKVQTIFAKRINLWLNTLSSAKKNKLSKSMINMLRILKKQNKDYNSVGKKELAYIFLDLLNTLTLMAREEFEKSHPKFSKSIGLSHERVFVLYIISISPGINLKELSIRTKTSSASLSLMINNLVEDGLVERNENSEDRRKITLNLTSKGKEISKETMKHYIKDIKKWLRKIANNDRVILQESLEDFVRIISESIGYKLIYKRGELLY